VGRRFSLSVRAASPRNGRRRRIGGEVGGLDVSILTARFHSQVAVGSCGPCSRTRALLDIRELAEAMLWAGQHVATAAELLGVDTATLRCRLKYLHPAERAFLTAELCTGETAC